MSELTYDQLQTAVTALSKRLLRRADTITIQAVYIADEAKDTARIADQIAAARVDKTSIAETNQLAHIMYGLADTITAYSANCTTTAFRAKAVHAQNTASHQPVKEAINRSPVGPEIYDVDRGWLLPE